MLLLLVNIQNREIVICMRIWRIQKYVPSVTETGLPLFDGAFPLFALCEQSLSRVDILANSELFTRSNASWSKG